MTLKKPCLIAETPRAGRWNGCLIISEGAQIDQATAVQYTTRARKGSKGEDYIMVSRRVMQPTTGRTGDELLILAGVVTKSYTTAKAEEVEKSLCELLNDLEKLVVQTIKWDEDRQPSIIERRELSDWIKNLPLTKKPTIPRSVPKKWTIPIVLVVLVVLWVAASHWPRGEEQFPKPGSDGTKVSSVGDTKKPEEEQRRLSHELENWRDALGLRKDDQESEANAREIVKTLEAKLIIEGRRWDSKEDPLRRLAGLLAEFDDIHPEGRKPGARDQNGTDEDQKQRIDSIVDHGTRERVVNFYNDYLRAGIGEAAFAYRGMKSKAELLISSDVGAFRRLVGTAHAVVKEANELKRVHGEGDDPILTSVQKMGIDPAADSSRVLTPGWSFYVPDDVAAMEQLVALMSKVVDASRHEDSGGQSSGVKGGPREIFPRFTSLDERFEGSKRSAPKHEKFYGALITLADLTKKYHPASPVSSTTQPRNPE